jgi:hypothetical protein
MRATWDTYLAVVGTRMRYRPSVKVPIYVETILPSNPSSSVQRKEMKPFDILGVLSATAAGTAKLVRPQLTMRCEEVIYEEFERLKGQTFTLKAVEVQPTGAPFAGIQTKLIERAIAGLPNALVVPTAAASISIPTGFLQWRDVLRAANVSLAQQKAAFIAGGIRGQLDVGTVRSLKLTGHTFTPRADERSSIYSIYAKAAINNTLQESHTTMESSIVVYKEDALKDGTMQGTGTLWVFVLVDLTQTYEPGTFIADTRLGQAQLRLLRTVENVPRWLWATVPDFEDKLDQLRTTQVVRIDEPQRDGSQLVDIRLSSNDDAWKFFSLRRLEHVNLKGAAHVRKLQRITSQHETTSCWVDGLKLRNARNKTMGVSIHNGGHCLEATLPQVLTLMLTAAGEQHPLPLLPQAFYTDFTWWNPGAWGIETIDGANYKLSGLGHIYPSTRVPKACLVIAHWAPGILTAIDFRDELVQVATKDSFAAQICLWDAQG